MAASYLHNQLTRDGSVSSTNNAFSKTVGKEACWGVFGTNVGQVGKANDDETGLEALKGKATQR